MKLSALKHGPAALCRMDKALLGDAARRESQLYIILSACLTIIVGTFVYGFAFGLWRSPLQGLYSAVKMPLLFFSVILTTTVINTMLAQIMGARISLRQVTMSVLLAMAVTAALIGGLSPIVLFLIANMASPDPSLVGKSFTDPLVASSASTYWTLLLTHVAVIGTAGIVGNIRLYRLLKNMVPGRMAIYLLLTWIFVIGFIGCQLAWLFSPFMCKPTYPAHFLALEYYQENFYERVLRAISTLITQH
ncbi:MAG: hypothetical protein WCN95_14040 [bacterium]